MIISVVAPSAGKGRRSGAAGGEIAQKSVWVRVRSSERRPMPDIHILPCRQPHSKSHIEGQTEAGPPAGYARVVDEQVMQTVKDSMPGNASCHQPLTPLESHYRQE